MSGPSGADLASELEQIVPPATSGFSVRDVPSAPGYKIGRGLDGVVALLTPPDPVPEPPTRLRTLSLDPRIRVHLESGDGIAIEEYYGLVQLDLVDQQLLQPFLEIAATVVRLLGSSPAPGEVSIAMRGLVKVFDPELPPQGALIGLWAELLVIVTSHDPAALVDAWHSQIDAAFDFSADGSRLEVKATTKGERTHTFNLRQLLPVTGARVDVVSVMTTETSAGTTVAGLVGRLEHQLSGDPARQLKIHSQVASTLGGGWVAHIGRGFDEQQAISSIALLAPADIPQVEAPPPAVEEVRLTVNCSGVPHRTASDGLASLVKVCPV